MFYRMFRLIRNTIEIYIPVLSFSVMFCAFIIQIFYRYILDDPLTWPFELTTVGFLWSAVFGGIYAMRTRSHIAFDVVYDLLPSKVQSAARIFSNSFLLVGFILALYPTYRYVSFMHIQQTPDFQIPFSVVYAPFVVFCGAVAVYAFIDLWKDVRPAFRRFRAEKGEVRHV